MPWSVDNPPSVAKNWTQSEKARCVAAANAALKDGKSDQQAIFACIGAAGKSKQKEDSLDFRACTIVEQVEITSIQEEKRIAEVTLVKAGWSENGRYYSPEVLAESVSLWEGARAFYNHGPSTSQARDVRELFGQYQGVKADPKTGAVKGELKVLDGEDKAWSLIKASVKNPKPPVGLSITGIAKIGEGEVDGKKGDVVEKILEAYSCDMVTHPAAGGSFEQIAASEEGGLTAVLLKHVTKQQLEEVRPDIVDAFKREWKTLRKGEGNSLDPKEIQEMLDKAVNSITAGFKTEVKTIADKVEAQGLQIGVLAKDFEERQVKLWAGEALAEAGIPVKMRESGLKNMLMLAGPIHEDSPEKTAASIKAKFAEYAKNAKEEFVAAGVKLDEKDPSGKGSSPPDSEGDKSNGEAGGAIYEKIGAKHGGSPFGETPDEFAKRTKTGAYVEKKG